MERKNKNYNMIAANQITQMVPIYFVIKHIMWYIDLLQAYMLFCFSKFGYSYILLDTHTPAHTYP